PATPPHPGPAARTPSSAARPPGCRRARATGAGLDHHPDPRRPQQPLKGTPITPARPDPAGHPAAGRGNGHHPPAPPTPKGDPWQTTSSTQPWPSTTPGSASSPPPPTAPKHPTTRGSATHEPAPPNTNSTPGSATATPASASSAALSPATS